MLRNGLSFSKIHVNEGTNVSESKRPTDGDE
jgi:hypothetical protein